MGALIRHAWLLVSLIVVYLVRIDRLVQLIDFIRNLYLFCNSCKTNVKYEIYDVL